MKKNKWKYYFVIVGTSAYGKEDIDEFDTWQETKKMVKEYRMAMPEFSLKVVKRKALNEGYTLEAKNVQV